MIYQTFSPKQIQAMLWWAMPKFRQYDAIICDGSVRSGKTMAMSIGYLLWSMRNFDHETFAFCGKTIDSLKRNVATPIQKWMAGDYAGGKDQPCHYALCQSSGNEPDQRSWWRGSSVKYIF